MLRVGAHLEEINTKLEVVRKWLRKDDHFGYLGGALCSDGRSEVEKQRRVQASANAMRMVGGVMIDSIF